MATIIQFPRPRRPRGGRELYLMGFLAMLEECKCANCMAFRAAVIKNPERAIMNMEENTHENR